MEEQREILLKVIMLLEDALLRVIGVIEAHDITSLCCDRDGETYCDCLSVEVNKAKELLYKTGRIPPAKEME